MAFSATIADRISFGNMKLRIYNLTDCQSSGSTLTLGLSRVYAVKAVNNTDSSDTFKEATGAHSATGTKDQVTFTPVTDNDDGHTWVWGK